jgi:hypothetical protein
LSEEDTYIALQMFSVMPTFAQYMEHLKKHVKYPATRSELLAACGNMRDIDAESREWLAANVPEGRYGSPYEVLKILLDKL